MLKATRTIQSKLFVYYSSIFLFIITTIILPFYFYSVKALENKTSESLLQLSSFIAKKLDNEIKDIDSLSTKILFSDPLTTLFSSNIFEETSDCLYSQRKFNEIIYSITGPEFPVFQINMFNLKGNYIGTGNYSSFSKLSQDIISSNVFIKDVINNDGSKFIMGTHYSSLPLSNVPVISLYRAFSRNLGGKFDSIIEIQQSYNHISSIIKDSLVSPNNSNIDKRIYVFDHKGSIVYPLATEIRDNSSAYMPNVKTYWDEISSRKFNSNTFIIKEMNTKSDEILAGYHSDYSDWTVIVVETKKNLLKPITDFKSKILIVAILILVITLLITYFVSKELTTPIKKIHKLIKDLNFETLCPKSTYDIRSSINELEDLNMSFQEMCLRLKESLDETVSSRSHEIQSRMLALQSQMNPHFLYNTITTISILGEESGQESITKACEDLSSMLRYISSDDANPVTIEEELDHTLNYLNLIKVRFLDDLTFSFNIPKEMHNIKIPKLIIQPLVENCTKYCTTIAPIWNIHIEGRLTDNSWEITVSDNGPGFDELKLRLLKENLSSIDPYNMLPTLKLNGMGLINIYIRLKLMYGSSSVFQLRNDSTGGTVVTIGGPLNID